MKYHLPSSNILLERLKFRTEVQPHHHAQFKNLLGSVVGGRWCINKGMQNRIFEPEELFYGFSSYTSSDYRFKYVPSYNQFISGSTDGSGPNHFIRAYVQPYGKGKFFLEFGVLKGETANPWIHNASWQEIQAELAPLFKLFPDAEISEMEIANHCTFKPTARFLEEHLAPKKFRTNLITKIPPTDEEVQAAEKAGKTAHHKIQYFKPGDPEFDWRLVHLVKSGTNKNRRTSIKPIWFSMYWLTKRTIDKKGKGSALTNGWNFEFTVRGSQLKEWNIEGLSCLEPKTLATIWKLCAKKANLFNPKPRSGGRRDLTWEKILKEI